MSNYNNCTDTIDRSFAAANPDVSWRRWFNEGVAMLLADTGSLFELLGTWQKRSRARFELATLDDRILRDIGLSRAERDIEAAKPFWRA